MDMERRAVVDVIIPALNEEKSISSVLRDIPDLVREVIVVDNGSTDKTAENAQKAGATVLTEKQKGYGSACLKGIAYLGEKPQEELPDIVVFMDGDYSDYPEELPYLIQPITQEGYDMVIGSRVTGERLPGSLTIPQIFGNWLATTLIRWIYGEKFTDLGPFRAIRYGKLLELDMQDKNYGWTVEMQVKAAKHKFKNRELPVKYRPRIGVSKVSGTVKGTVLAAHKILFTIFKLL